jgi:hypothetical protein
MLQASDGWQALVYKVGRPLVLDRVERRAGCVQDAAVSALDRLLERRLGLRLSSLPSTLAT